MPDLLKKGYTIVELMIVIGIMAVISTVAFYGLKSNNDRQAVVNAQLEFVSNLRSIVNGVNAGNNNGMHNKILWINTSAGLNTSYKLYDNNGTPPQNILETFPLPSNIILKLQNITQPQMYICIPNPSITTYNNVPGNTNPLDSYCPKCGAGTYFACLTNGLSVNNQITNSTVTVRFQSSTNPLIYKDVDIEGVGMTITRINPK